MVVNATQLISLTMSLSRNLKCKKGWHHFKCKTLVPWADQMFKSYLKFWPYMIVFYLLTRVMTTNPVQGKSRWKVSQNIEPLSQKTGKIKHQNTNRKKLLFLKMAQFCWKSVCFACWSECCMPAPPSRPNTFSFSFPVLHKYILQFGKIYLAVWKNTFGNLDKYM